jgi:GNAT superfamily N-acetyltransferase
MNIIQVATKKELRQFMDFVYDFYRDDLVWVPPLREDLHNQYDPIKNPFLDHCKTQLFLLKDGEKIIGRIAAFYDQLLIEASKENIGLFGYYECPEDLQASHLLLDAAQNWLKEQGMSAMQGPWSFVSQEWGAVLEGFEPSPVVMGPYNPPYYNHHFTAYGLEKIKDLMVYVIDANQGYKIPGRILTLTDQVAQKYGICVRPIDMAHLEKEIAIINELSNESLINNWGFSPVTEAEVNAMARDLKPVIQPKAVMFAEDRTGRPIGFSITIPDVNVLIKNLNGHLFPFGWIKLLWGIPRLTQYRMFALGVIPEYQGKAIDSLLYRALYEACYTPTTRMEINYVLEDNGPMNNAIIKLGASPLRKYRIYKMQL